MGSSEKNKLIVRIFATSARTYVKDRVKVLSDLVKYYAGKDAAKEACFKMMIKYYKYIPLPHFV